jgi:hypothetical protein
MLERRLKKLLELTAILLFSWLVLGPLIHFHQVQVLHSFNYDYQPEFIKPKASDSDSKSIAIDLEKIVINLASASSDIENSWFKVPGVHFIFDKPDWLPVKTGFVHSIYSRPPPLLS